MKISQLTISNFRSIRSLNIELPQICALVGPNNAGKSNILLAIQRVLGRDWISVSSFEEDDVYVRQPDLDVSIALSFAVGLLFALAPTFLLAFVGRTLVGLGVSVVFIAMLKLIAVGFEERRFATLTGVSMMVGNLGSILAGAPLVESTHGDLKFTAPLTAILNLRGK